MSNKELVSVVVLTKNSAKTLSKCLESINENKGKHNIETIIVDGGSTDDTIEIAKQYGVNRILQDDGKGLAYARDVGWRYAKGTYILFIDSDVLLPPDFSDKALQIFAFNQDAGGVSAKLNYTCEGRGIHVKFQCYNIYYLAQQSFPVFPSEASLLNTACALCRRDALEKVDGFDHDFAMAWENVNISERLKEAGYKIHYVDSFATHIEFADRFRKQNFKYGKAYVLLHNKYPKIFPLLTKKWIFNSIMVFTFPLLTPICYLRHLQSYLRIKGLPLTTRLGLTLIEVERQIIRTLGLLYQLITG